MSAAHISMDIKIFFAKYCRYSILKKSSNVLETLPLTIYNNSFADASTTSPRALDYVLINKRWEALFEHLKLSRIVYY